MELEHRIEALEREVKTLNIEIQRTLVEIQEALPERPAAPSGWQKKAWVLALINILMAVALFTNIYLYLPGSMPFEINATLVSWLRAFWLVMAFIWLLLQMYPLALLLEQEDRQWQGVVWRNAAVLFRDRPGFVVVLTLAVLVVSIVNTVIPAAWLLVALTLLVGVGSMVVRYMLELYRERIQAHGRG